jgi:hypothetical protein
MARMGIGIKPAFFIMKNPNIKIKDTDFATIISLSAADEELLKRFDKKKKIKWSLAIISANEADVSDILLWEKPSSPCAIIAGESGIQSIPGTLEFKTTVPLKELDNLHTVLIWNTLGEEWIYSDVKLFLMGRYGHGNSVEAVFDGECDYMLKYQECEYGNSIELVFEGQQMTCWHNKDAIAELTKVLEQEILKEQNEL